MKKALVTLVAGQRYRDLFSRHAVASWRAYAKRHDFDLIVIDRLLDDSERGRSRSPAWQKCLVLSEPRVRRYDRVVWLDVDVAINADLAPDIVAAVPEGRLGAVEAYSAPSEEDFTAMLQAAHALQAGAGANFFRDLTRREFYANFGLADAPDEVVQTGVMVLDPALHREVLEDVYHGYESRGGAEMQHEMRPLSFEIVKRAAVTWLDPRFNALWAASLLLHYGFLTEKKLLAAFKGHFEPYAYIKSRCVAAALARAYFLHFAGTGDDMRFLPASPGHVSDDNP